LATFQLGHSVRVDTRGLGASKFYFWPYPRSYIFQGQKKRTFYNSVNGHFLFLMLLLRDPPMEIGEIIIDICHTGRPSSH